MQIDETNYDAAWNDYKRRRFWFIFAFAGYTPCCAILGVILKYSTGCFTLKFQFMQWLDFG